MSAFWELYQKLDREGPGTAEDVIWALKRAGTGPRARIADAGCGSGADTLVLAEARPAAQVTGVERAAHLAAEARVRLAGTGAEVVCGDMADLSGPLDFIWCAGALYFLGVTEGLTLWRKTLAPGARIAFSEPCLMQDSPATRAFWAEYPALTDAAGIAARVEAAGFRVIDTRPVIGAGWAAYFASLQVRIDDLRLGADDELIAVLDAAQDEIDLWRSAPDEIAYLLCLVEVA